MHIAQGLLFSKNDIKIKHFQIYAIYDWLAYNENKEAAPAQEQGDEIFPKKIALNINRKVFYIFVNSFKYEIGLKMPLSSERKNSIILLQQKRFLQKGVICVSIYILHI